MKAVKLKLSTYMDSGLMYLVYQNQGQGPIIRRVTSLDRFYNFVGLGGSVGCAVRLETRRSQVQPPLRSATFFRGD